MTQLICLIRAANIKDRRCIKFNEVFETDEIEAESLIRGRIAKAVPSELTQMRKSEPVKADPPMAPEDLYQKAQELKEEPDAVQQTEEAETPEKVTVKKKGKR
jgi:hypothetical protein